MSETKRGSVNPWVTYSFPKDGMVKGESGEVTAVDEAAHSVDVAESYRRVRELEGPQQPVVPCDHVNVGVKLVDPDEINGNKRVYPKDALRSAAQELADRIAREKAEHPMREVISMQKGDEADLFNEEGTARMGRVIYDGCGVFRLKEDPNDIRLGDWLWALAVAHTGDPQVVYAEVRAIWTEQRKGREPVIEVNLFTKAGVLVYGKREHIFPTKEAAEAARMKILEEGL